MTSASPKNIVASIRQKLLNLARKEGRPFNEVLQYYAMERFLYRLSQTRHADAFVLKGALLFRVWATPDSRSTRDIDFLAYLNNSPADLAAVIKDVCSYEYLHDGIVFDPTSVAAAIIKENAEYEGVRIRFLGNLASARVHMQVDVGFGDTISPKATIQDYPTMLPLAAPRLAVYPPETVVAEKVEAMVKLGILNSRMKDFFDVWRLCQIATFTSQDLKSAIQQTFNNRGTALVSFAELKSELKSEKRFEQQWAAFRSKSQVAAPAEFHLVLDALGDFLSPVLAVAPDRTICAATWSPGGPWIAD
jgi:predicted nucleotidyltransferase component of viral defense system